jgi:cysteinyl-tRNA synthetase
LTSLWSGEAELDPKGLGETTAKAVREFDEAMSDDFNTPRAIGVLFDVVREVRAAGMEAKGMVSALSFLQEAAGDILGVLSERPSEIPSEDLSAQLLEMLVELRGDARERRDWAQADRIRDRLKELGVMLEDTPAGTRWVVRSK